MGQMAAAITDAKGGGGEVDAKRLELVAVVPVPPAAPTAVSIPIPAPPSSPPVPPLPPRPPRPPRGASRPPKPVAPSLPESEPEPEPEPEPGGREDEHDKESEGEPPRQRRPARSASHSRSDHRDRNRERHRDREEEDDDDASLVGKMPVTRETSWSRCLNRCSCAMCCLKCTVTKPWSVLCFLVAIVIVVGIALVIKTYASPEAVFHSPPPDWPRPMYERLANGSFVARNITCPACEIRFDWGWLH